MILKSPWNSFEFPSLNHGTKKGVDGTKRLLIFGCFFWRKGYFQVKTNKETYGRGAALFPLEE